MQRNMDLVRLILMKMESSPSGWTAHDLGIHSFQPAEIGYHAHIMLQEGLRAHLRLDESADGPHAARSAGSCHQDKLAG